MTGFISTLRDPASRIWPVSGVSKFEGSQVSSLTWFILV